jgi:hypothetical protein
MEPFLRCFEFFSQRLGPIPMSTPFRILRWLSSNNLTSASSIPQSFVAKQLFLQSTHNEANTTDARFTSLQKTLSRDEAALSDVKVLTIYKPFTPCYKNQKHHHSRFMSSFFALLSHANQLSFSFLCAVHENFTLSWKVFFMFA